MLRFIKFSSQITAFIVLSSLATYAAESRQSLPSYSTLIQSVKVSEEFNKSVGRLDVAYAFLEVGRYEDAAAELELAISELKGHDVIISPRIYINAGYLNRLAQNFLKAIDYYEIAKGLLSNQSKSRENNTLLKILYKDQSQIDSELKKLDNSLSKVYILEAQLTMEAKSWSKTAKLFDRGLELVVDIDEDTIIYAIIYANAGKSHLAIENYPKAYQYLAKAIELNPGLPQIVHDRLATAEAALKESKGE